MKKLIVTILLTIPAILYGQQDIKVNSMHVDHKAGTTVTAASKGLKLWNRGVQFVYKDSTGAVHFINADLDTTALAFLAKNNAFTGKNSFADTTIMHGLTMPDGAANGYVWKCDADGVGSWQYAETSYKGTWNANLNLPEIEDGTGSAGDFYIVTEGDTIDLGSGDVIFFTGGFAIYSGTVWESVYPTMLVNSVNGMIGNVQIDLSQTATHIKITGGDSIPKDTSKIYGPIGYIPKFTATKAIGPSILKELSGNLVLNTGAHRTLSIAQNSNASGDGYNLLFRAGYAGISGAKGGDAFLLGGNGLTTPGNVYIYGGIDQSTNYGGVYLGHNGTNFAGNVYVPNVAPEDSSYNSANTAFVRHLTDSIWANLSGAGVVDTTGTPTPGRVSVFTAPAKIGNSVISLTGIDLLLISTFKGGYADGKNIFVGGGGQHSTAPVYATVFGSYNTSIGDSSLFQNTTGLQNTAVGSNALRDNTTGYQNTAVGTDALAKTTTVNECVGIGAYSLQMAETASKSTAVGIGSLANIVGGDENIGIGAYCGVSEEDGSTPNTSSSNSIFIGNGTRTKAASQSNEIVVGDQAIGHGTNTATWGNTAITDHYFSGTIHGLTVDTATVARTAMGVKSATDILFGSNASTGRYMRMYASDGKTQFRHAGTAIAETSASGINALSGYPYQYNGAPFAIPAATIGTTPAAWQGNDVNAVTPKAVKLYVAANAGYADLTYDGTHLTVDDDSYLKFANSLGNTLFQLYGSGTATSRLNSPNDIAFSITGSASTWAQFSSTSQYLYFSGDNKLKTVSPGVEILGSIVNSPLPTGAISASVGITSAMLSSGMRYSGSSSVDITAVPQIADGADGQEIKIIGLSNTNTLKLDDGNGLALAGGVSFTIGAGDCIVLTYVASLDEWIEVTRSDN